MKKQIKEHYKILRKSRKFQRNFIKKYKFEPDNNIQKKHYKSKKYNEYQICYPDSNGVSCTIKVHSHPKYMLLYQKYKHVYYWIKINNNTIAIKKRY